MLLLLSAADAELSALCPAELAHIIAGMHRAPFTLTLAEVDALLAAVADGPSAAASARAARRPSGPAQRTSNAAPSLAALTSQFGAPANDDAERHRAQPASAPPAGADTIPNAASTRPTASQLPPARLPRAPGASRRPDESPLPASTFVPSRRMSPLPSQQASASPTRRDLPPIRPSQAPQAAVLHAPLMHEDTGVRPLEAVVARAQVEPSPHESAQPAPQGLAPRDPDAEFDALLADASAPSATAQRARLDGEPTRDRPSTPLWVDDDIIEAMAGLQEAPPPREERPSSPTDTALESIPAGLKHPLADATDDSIDIAIDTGDLVVEGDSTEVFDQSLLHAIKAANEARDAEELDLSELDIELDAELDPALAASATPALKPPPVPESSRGSAPTDHTQVEKRPSFLGRLFTKKDSDPS